MKILVICSQGLGTSLILEMCIKNVLKKMNLSNIEVSHTNLNSYNPNDYFVDAIFCTTDIEDQLQSENKYVVKNIFNMEEIEDQLTIMLDLDK